MFVTAIIFGILFVVAGVLSLAFHHTNKRAKAVMKDSGSSSYYDNLEEDSAAGRLYSGIATGILLVGSAVFLLLASFFTQDPGEAKVIRTWTGELAGYETTEGLHWKAPWTDVISFDIRNQRVVYTGGDSQGDNSGGMADGAQITVQDAEGVTANIDITVRYSIKPDAVIGIYKEYGNEESLRSKLVFNDIRSVVRSVPGSFTTLELLTSRNEVQAAILSALEARWEDEGLIVDDVALQEIRYSEEVKTSFAQAAQAKIDVETARANLERQEVDAQQLVQQAQAQADANSVLNAQPLSEQSIRLRYIEALEKLATAGNLVIVPEGFNGMVNLR